MHSPSLLGTLAVASSLALLLGGCDSQESENSILRNLTQEVILPTYTQWQQSNHTLNTTTEAFCQGEATLATAQQAFFQAQANWAKLQPILLGPLDETNLSWQIQFWPDKKNLVARQVGNFLRRYPDPSPNQVEQASVVIQGLSAYEYLFFDPDIDLQQPELKAKYCPLAQAIGTHQQRLAQQVMKQWQAPNEGLARQLEQQPNTRYADSREAFSDLLRVHITALDVLKKKLRLPLGTQEQVQPYQAEAWRSQRSLDNIRFSLQTAQQLWAGSGDAPGIQHLLGNAHHDLKERINYAYQNAQQQLDNLQQPLIQLLKNSAGQTALQELYTRLNNLHRLHQGELAQALGIQIGFNAHDGD